MSEQQFGTCPHCARPVDDGALIGDAAVVREAHAPVRYRERYECSVCRHSWWEEFVWSGQSPAAPVNGDLYGGLQFELAPHGER